MGFLSPWLLASFAALAVPLWLHLRRRRRQTPVEFPSLRYLQMAAARIKRQAKVEDLGLLLLRLVLVALLAAAFARPVIRARGQGFGSARAVECVVVIDATASMACNPGGTSRFQSAKRLAREWIDAMDPADAAALWVLTDRLRQPVPVPTHDRGHWLGQLDALTPSEGSSSMGPAFAAAREWAATRGAARKELVIITDNQTAAWDWPAASFFDRGWHRLGVGLVVLSPDDQAPSNLTIEQVAWQDPNAKAGGLLNGVVKITNHGAAAATDLLECRSGGRVLLRKPVELAADGSLEVPFAVAVPDHDAPVFTGEWALAGDVLTSDDRWCFALPQRRAIEAMVVDRGTTTGAARPSFFLTRALAAGGAGTARAIESSQWPDQPVEGFTSVWFTGATLTEAGAWSKALNYAAAGGTVVITADNQPEPVPAAWPVSAGDALSLPPGRIATRILSTTHPLFRGIWDDHTTFPPLPQKTVRSCQSSTGTTVLATIAGELPLLVDMRHGDGRVLWLNASVDRSWGDLPLSPVFVPMVQQLARAAELELQTQCQLWVGESWPALTTFPAGTAWPVDADPDTHDRASRSGIFDALTPTDGKTRWHCAVNVRRAESDLRPVPATTLQAMLPGRLATGTAGIQQSLQQARREVPLWPWLLAAAALTFIAETCAAHRAAHRRQPAAGPTPASTVPRNPPNRLGRSTRP